MTEVNKSSVPLLHFVAVIENQCRMLGFCCETQPLVTVRSYGNPKRCPFCLQENPVSTGLSVRKKREKICGDFPAA